MQVKAGKRDFTDDGWIMTYNASFSSPGRSKPKDMPCKVVVTGCGGRTPILSNGATVPVQKARITPGGPGTDYPDAYLLIWVMNHDLTKTAAEGEAKSSQVQASAQPPFKFNASILKLNYVGFPWLLVEIEAGDGTSFEAMYAQFEVLSLPN